MTPNRPSKGFLTSRKTFRHPGFEISWAGEGPRNSGFCFGSEDGRLLFIDVDATQGTAFSRLAESGEAANGVAFLDDYLAVSTRSEVAFFDAPRPGETRFPRAAVYGGGAHGVVATPTGKFVAPLGPNGLLLMTPQPGGPHRIQTLNVEGATFNFYTAVRSGIVEGGNVLTCALRRGGWATVVDNDTSGSLNVFPSPGLDVVDVCSIGTRSSPYAVAALGIDRTLHLIENVLNPRKRSILQTDGFQGVPYRVMALQGHLILLTSDGIFLMPRHVTRFLNGERVAGRYTATWLDLQAVDASVAYDRWLLVVMPDGGASILEVDQLASKRVHTSSSVTTREDLPGWEAPSAYPLTFSDAFLTYS